MKLDNSKAQMRRGVLGLCILSIIEKEEMYPSDLIRKMKEAELIIVEGTLYPLLTRLKNAGLLTYRWEESANGPPRKYYSLTPMGLEFQQELKQNWDSLVDSVKIITENPKITSK